MRPWAVAVGLLAACGAMLGAALVGMRAQVSAESASGALVLAERASQAQVKVQRERRETSSPPPATPKSADLPPRPAPQPVSFRQTATYNGAAVYVPDDCAGPYDVLLHFHGAAPYVKDEVQSARLHAVVAVFNAGNGAEKYAQAFQATGTLSSLLRQVELAVAPLCSGEGARPRRIALSGFSAGFAAVEKLLQHEEDRQRVDAALLVDGLHAGFVDPRRRQMAPNALQAFRRFGELAKQGSKLLAVTHSSIMTDGYASTTECSRFLLQALSVPCDGELVSGKAGQFSIEGFTGNDKAAHIAQFRQMDSTLLTKLRARWADAP
jgi:hypothetical protein